MLQLSVILLQNWGMKIASKTNPLFFVSSNAIPKFGENLSETFKVISEHTTWPNYKADYVTLFCKRNNSSIPCKQCNSVTHVIIIIITLVCTTLITVLRDVFRDVSLTL